MNNADRIRQMTDEELVFLLAETYAKSINLPWCDYNKDESWCELDDCNGCIAEWLKQEAEG